MYDNSVSFEEYEYKANLVKSWPKEGSETQMQYIQMLSRLAKPSSVERSRTTWQIIIKSVDHFPNNDADGYEFYKEELKRRYPKRRGKSNSSKKSMPIDDICVLEKEETPTEEKTKSEKMFSEVSESLNDLYLTNDLYKFFGEKRSLNEYTVNEIVEGVKQIIYTHQLREAFGTNKVRVV